MGQETAGLYYLDKDPQTGLTRREREVLAGLQAKKTQLAIAAELGISRQRVRQLTEQLMRKGKFVSENVKLPPPP